MATVGQPFLSCFSHGGVTGGRSLCLLSSSKRLLIAQYTHDLFPSPEAYFESPRRAYGKQHRRFEPKSLLLLTTAPLCCPQCSVLPNNLGFWATITSLDVGKLQLLLQPSTFNDSTAGSVSYTTKCIHAKMFGTKPV